jgi:hypothetical protein
MENKLYGGLTVFPESYHCCEANEEGRSGNSASSTSLVLGLYRAGLTIFPKPYICCEANKRSGSGDSVLLAPGLYKTGAIALWQEGNYDAASAMMITPWEELEANNDIMVSKGEDIELPEMNEYGFYFGVPYSRCDDPVSYTFYEDGSAKFDEYGDVIEAPAGSVIYSDHCIDLSVAMDAENYMFMV